MDTSKAKERYHKKFRKNIDRNKSYMKQLLDKAWNEYRNHPAFDPYRRPNGVNNEDRVELKALNELIKLYESQIELNQVEYTSC